MGDETCVEKSIHITRQDTARGREGQYTIHDFRVWVDRLASIANDVAMSNPIDMDVVRRIGTLSRIALTEEEVSTFSRQMGDMLGYFDKLQELDTESVEPMAYAVERTNVLADDAVHESLTPQQALANAPGQIADLFTVPKVLDQGS